MICCNDIVIILYLCVLPSNRVTSKLPCVHWWIQCWKVLHFCSTSETVLVISLPLGSIVQYWRKSPSRPASTVAYGTEFAGRYIRYWGITLWATQTHSELITSSVMHFNRSQLIEQLNDKCSTYSSEKPKFSITLASAAKILQYSRIMFWTLHSWQHK